MNSVISIYAPIFAIFYVILSVTVIRTRRQEKVGLGTAGNKAVERAMRVHANFSEYVPLALLLLLILEQSGGNEFLLHGLFLMLLAGRLIHAWGISRQRENFRFRVSGMTMTFAVIITSSIAIAFLRFA
ncbi:MAPEG family protein [Aestuariivirga sp.]|uniref:MAPEG family protein n=1 Tax=Aestuariivirga sp. TaxID=2650926 RepID=UPI0025BBC701|nr:MAPEG family protein [Aestuariivirga sp.]MCA3553984.1 MAPEG family protein [Aestuariivirga sp.]